MLQAIGQQDPLVAYKRQGFDMFQQFQVIFRKNVVYQIFHVLFDPNAPSILMETRIVPDEPARTSGNGTAQASQIEKTARDVSSHSKRNKGRSTAPTKIGRNDPCYCGSGKKYKHCHGGAGVPA
jgi:preprotein translocase subunit SecA